MLKLGQNKAARLDYQSGTFRVLSGGDHVICAVTGARVDLADLRYWSYELQEAYSTAEVASARYTEALEAGKL